MNSNFSNTEFNQQAFILINEFCHKIELINIDYFNHIFQLYLNYFNKLEFHISGNNQIGSNQYIINNLKSEYEKRKLTGGRKIKNNLGANNIFNSDDEFRKDARMDENNIETPIKKYMEEEDGNMILEEYYLAEAILNGKPSKKLSKKRY